MPFRSRAQQRYLFAQHPDVAKRFAADTPADAYAHLPQHVAKHKHAHHLVEEMKRRTRGHHH